MDKAPVIASEARQSILAQLLPWLPIILGLAVLYLPSLYDLFTGIWSSDEQMHGPIVLGISIWLLYRNWPTMEAVAQGKKTSNRGWPIFLFGLPPGVIVDAVTVPMRMAVTRSQ